MQSGHEPFKEEWAFYNEKKDDLLRAHPGQFARIKGRELLGVFPTREAAHVEGVQQFGRTDRADAP